MGAVRCGRGALWVQLRCGRTRTDSPLRPFPDARAPRASGPLLTMPPPASRGRLLHPAPGHVPGGHQAGRGAVRVPGPPAQGTVAFACPMASPVSRSPIVALSRLHRLACIPFLSSTARRRRPRCWRRRAHSWRRTTLPPSRRRQAFASWTSHSRHSSFFIYSVLRSCACVSERLLGVARPACALASVVAEPSMMFVWCSLLFFFYRRHLAFARAHVPGVGAGGAHSALFPHDPPFLGHGSRPPYNIWIHSARRDRDHKRVGFL